MDLDVLIIATNAPGRSAYNRVERRMAPLSKELSGIVLPYDHFGSHLDEKHQTVDSDLELRNFKHSGDVLSEVWSSMIIDIEPETLNQAPIPDMKWHHKHVREVQYILQIIKCDFAKKGGAAGGPFYQTVFYYCRIHLLRDQY